jgi:uncharacterized protein YkwD
MHVLPYRPTPSTVSARSPVLLLVLALLALAGPSPAVAACPGEHGLPAADTTGQARKATLCLLNAERRRHGAPRLRQNARLRRAATRHSRAMVRERFFSHVAPSGSTMVGRIVTAGYRRWASLGENIAWGSGSLAAPAAVVRSWMDSPGHRANLLDPRFREIGIGIVPGAPRTLPAGQSGATYTTDFGVRR